MIWTQLHGYSFPAVLAMALVGLGVGCSDDVAGEEDCPDGQQWNPIAVECQPADGGDNQLFPNNNQPPADTGEDLDARDDADGGEHTDPDADDNGDDPDANGDNDCPGPDCPDDPDPCDPIDNVGTIAGTVHIPSGQLPLPDVTVYVPEVSLHELDPIDSGASCVRCEDELSADPVVDTTTDAYGSFRLDDVPVGQEIPLVIEVGKWRRTTTVSAVEACETTTVAADDIRLPRNRNEGEIPQIAVTTGECDAVECLIRKIGIDDDEITTDRGDGAVHLFTGRTADDDEAEGPTYRFADDFNDGAVFTDAEQWWDDEDDNNLLDYDIMLNACECSPIPKSSTANDAFEEFTDEGGRAFLTHYHHTWLSDGPSQMETVADWNTFAGIPGGFDQTATGYINTTFPKGMVLRDWLSGLGTTPPGEFEIHHVRGSVDSIDDDTVQDWVTVEDSGGFGFGQDEYIQYFSFNTPIGIDEDDQCGRVVFSDIHVSGREMDFDFGGSPNQDVSSPDHPFPEGCYTDDFSDQEKALVFMLFDLSACIISDQKKKADL